jgi:hypothetical protein
MIIEPLRDPDERIGQHSIVSADARQWQSRWESVLIARSLLMTVALLALLLAIRVSGRH